MGEIYCLVCIDDEIKKRLHSGDCSNCLHYGTGKCFKALAEDEVERVKELLRHLREPVTEGNQLPKLTTEVFDRPNCPKWAKFAVVDADGTACWYGKRPFFNIHNNKWYPDCTDCCNRVVEGRYDASDWKNSLIERPVKETKLPDWCKVDAVCWHKRCGYFKATNIDDVSNCVYIQQVEDKSKGYLSFHTVCNKVKPARFRPYNAEEMKALVGRTVAQDYGAVYLVTKFVDTSEGGEVCVDDIWYNADSLLDKFTINNKPAGVLEHLNEEGVWVQ